MPVLDLQTYVSTYSPLLPGPPRRRLHAGRGRPPPRVPRAAACRRPCRGASPGGGGLTGRGQAGNFATPCHPTRGHLMPGLSAPLLSAQPTHCQLRIPQLGDAEVDWRGYLLHCSSQLSGGGGGCVSHFLQFFSNFPKVRISLHVFFFCCFPQLIICIMEDFFVIYPAFNFLGPFTPLCLPCKLGPPKSGPQGEGTCHNCEEREAKNPFICLIGFFGE